MSAPSRLRLTLRSRGNVIGRAIHSLPSAWLIFWCLSALWMSGASSDFDLPNTLREPSLTHPFGFDAFGRDLLLTVLHASANSLLFASAAVAASVALGLLLGGALSQAGERSRFVFLRLLDTFLAFPSLLLALAWAAIRGPGWDTLVVALGIGVLPGFTRLVYVRSRELLEEDYVRAAEAFGAGKRRILTHHLTPSLLSVCLVKVPGLFAYALIAEATLSFLGVGLPAGRDSWGSLLAQSKDYLIEAPHLSIGTGIPLFLTVLSLQLLSERASKRHLL